MIAQWRGVVIERGVDADASAQQVSDPSARLQRNEGDRVAESNFSGSAWPQIHLAGALVRRDRSHVNLTRRHPLELLSVDERLSCRA